MDVCVVGYPVLLCVPPFFPFLLWRLLCFLPFFLVFFCPLGFVLLSGVAVVLSAMFGLAVSCVFGAAFFLRLSFRFAMLGSCVASFGVKFPPCPSLPSGGGGLFFSTTGKVENDRRSLRLDSHGRCVPVWDTRGCSCSILAQPQTRR